MHTKEETESNSKGFFFRGRKGKRQQKREKEVQKEDVDTSEQSRVSLRITRKKTSRWQWARKRQDKHKTTRAKAYPSQDVSQPPEPASTCNRCSNAIGLYFTKSNFSVCSYFVIIFLMCLHLFLYLIQGAFTLVSRTFISWPLTSQWHHLLQFCTVRLTRFLDPVRRGRACNCVCHCSGKWW